MTARQPSSPELELLRTSPVGVATPAEIEQERAVLLPWLEQQIFDLPQVRARARRRRRAFLAGGAVALMAAAAGVALLWTSGQKPTAPFLDAGDPPFATLVSGSLESGTLELLPGSRLGMASQVRSSAQGSAVLAASAGYRLELRPSTELMVAPSTPKETRLVLLEGEIALAVPKLSAGQTLAVETRDATVRVRGTRFSVRVAGDQPESVTCVRVTEGLVEVQQNGTTRNVAAGESVGCDAVARHPASANEPRQSGPATDPAARSTLAEENRLLSRALAAERAGDWSRARQDFSELLRRFPHSRFLPEARAGIERAQNERP